MNGRKYIYTSRPENEKKALLVVCILDRCVNVIVKKVI